MKKEKKIKDIHQYTDQIVTLIDQLEGLFAMNHVSREIVREALSSFLVILIKQSSDPDAVLKNVVRKIKRSFSSFDDYFIVKNSMLVSKEEWEKVEKKKGRRK